MIYCGPRPDSSVTPPLVLRAVRRRAWARWRSAQSAGRGSAAAAAPRRPIRWRRKQPHFAAQGQARHLPVHGRRAQPSGAVRQQAAAGEVRRHAAARRSCSRAIAPRSSIRTRSCWARSSSSPSTASAAPSCPSCCRTWPTVVDDIAIVKSMVTDAFNHAPGADPDEHRHRSSSAGRASAPGRPTAWAANRRTCPASSCSAPARRAPAAATRNWGSGFLPTVYQGVPFRSSGDPVLYLSNPPGVDATTAARLARRAQPAQPACGSTSVGDPEIATRINSFEMAFRMQSSAPELMDISQRAEARRSRCTAPSRASRRSPTTACWPAGWSSAACASCSSSTRPGTSTATWSTTCKKNCHDTDQACAALVKDLKQRGLLDDTLVIWGGEFGRTPMVQGGNDGRDHHPNAFTMWLAGGGIKPGITLGETDEFGFNAVEGPGPRPRPARHDPAPAGLRPHAS